MSLQRVPTCALVALILLKSFAQAEDPKVKKNIYIQNEEKNNKIFDLIF